MWRHHVLSIQHSMQHSVLCALYSVLGLFQVGLTVLGRPFREVDWLISWPVGRREREWGVGLRPTAYFLRPRHGVRHIIAARDEARPQAGADGRDAHPYLVVYGGPAGTLVPT